MSPEVSRRVIEVKLWLTGHTYSEIRSLSLQELGDILAYWEDNRKADEKLERQRKHHAKAKRRSK